MDMWNDVDELICYARMAAAFLERDAPELAHKMRMKSERVADVLALGGSLRGNPRCICPDCGADLGNFYSNRIRMEDPAAPHLTVAETKIEGLLDGIFSPNMYGPHIRSRAAMLAKEAFELGVTNPK